MDFDAVEARALGILRRAAVLLDDTRNFREIQCAWCHEGLWTRKRHRFPGGPNGRGRHRQFALRQQGGMRNAPDVPQLQKDVPAPRVHGSGDHLPARHLCLGMDARCGGIAVPQRADGRCLADNQTSRRTLGIVGSVQLARNITRAGTVARQRCHDDAVGQHQRTDLDRRKQINLCFAFGCHGLPALVWLSIDSDVTEITHLKGGVGIGHAPAHQPPGPATRGSGGIEFSAHI